MNYRYLSEALIALAEVVWDIVDDLERDRDINERNGRAGS